VDMYSLGTVMPLSVCGFLSIVGHLPVNDPQYWGRGCTYVHVCTG